MNARLISIPEVQRPTPAPLRGSLLDHFPAKTIDHFGLRNNEGLWPSYNCLDTAHPLPMPCADDLQGFKQFDSAPWVPAFEFAIQAGVQCSLIGLDQADQKSELGRVFLHNEGRNVERALYEYRFAATDSDAPVQWDDPVDLTPVGQDISAQVALALLEGYAAANYAGVPTIHMPRAAVSLLGDRVVWTNGLPFTRSGARIAAGGGYDELSADGTWEFFVTGEVYVEKIKTLVFQQITIPGDGSGLGSDENGLADNTSIVLVEGLYRVGIDCLVAKVEATVW